MNEKMLIQLEERYYREIRNIENAKTQNISTIFIYLEIMWIITMIIWVVKDLINQ